MLVFVYSFDWLDLVDSLDFFGICDAWLFGLQIRLAASFFFPGTELFIVTVSR